MCRGRPWFLPRLAPACARRAFRRADDLAIAMEARCYRGGENRTRMKKLRFGKIDLICSIALLIYLGAIIYLWRGSYGF